MFYNAYQRNVRGFTLVLRICSGDTVRVCGVSATHRHRHSWASTVQAVRQIGRGVLSIVHRFEEHNPKQTVTRPFNKDFVLFSFLFVSS